MSKTGLFLLLLSAGIAIISVLAEYEPDVERTGAAHYKVTFRVGFFSFLLLSFWDPSFFFSGPHQTISFVPPALSTVQKLCI